MTWPLSAAATARLLADRPVDRSRLLRLSVQELALVGAVTLRTERTRWRRTTLLSWPDAPVPGLAPLPLVAARLRAAGEGEVRRLARTMRSADPELATKVELACTTALVEAGLARVDERRVLGVRRRRLVRTPAGVEALEAFAVLPLTEPAALLLRASSRERRELDLDFDFDLGDDLGFSDGGGDGGDGGGDGGGD